MIAGVFFRQRITLGGWRVFLKVSLYTFASDLGDALAFALLYRFVQTVPMFLSAAYELQGWVRGKPLGWILKPLELAQKPGAPQ